MVSYFFKLIKLIQSKDYGSLPFPFFAVPMFRQRFVRFAHIERHMTARATRRRTVANIKYCKKCDEVTIPEESDEEFCYECKESNEYKESNE